MRAADRLLGQIAEALPDGPWKLEGGEILHSGSAEERGEDPVTAIVREIRRMERAPGGSPGPEECSADAGAAAEALETDAEAVLLLLRACSAEPSRERLAEDLQLYDAADLTRIDDARCRVSDADVLQLRKRVLEVLRIGGAPGGRN